MLVVIIVVSKYVTLPDATHEANELMPHSHTCLVYDPMLESIIQNNCCKNWLSICLILHLALSRKKKWCLNIFQLGSNMLIIV